jgi:hypothetical protein
MRCYSLKDIIKKKDAAISRLQFDLAKACKAHNDMLHDVETRLKEFGLPVNDLKFSALRPGPHCPSIRSGPLSGSSKS